MGGFALELGVVIARAVGIGDASIIGVEVSSGIVGGGTKLNVSPSVGTGEGVSNGAGLAASIGLTLAVGNGLTVAVGEGCGFAVGVAFGFAVAVGVGFGFAVEAGVGLGLSSAAPGVLARKGVEAASCA